MNIEKNPLTTQLDIGGVWHQGGFIILSLCVLGFIWQQRKTVGICGSVFWAYLLLCALYTIEYPTLLYGLYNTAFQVTAGQVFIEALVIPIGVLLAPRSIWRILPWVVAGEIACVWSPMRGGLFGWCSFDLAFIALCLPFLNPWLIFISLVTIFTHHGSTALMIILAQISVLAFKIPKFRKFLVLIVPFFLLIAHIHQIRSWFDSGERLATYKHFMTFWWKKSWWYRVFGIGPGSFLWCSLMIDKYEAPLWLQMHSEPLQILFELGIIGFTLSIGFFFTLVKRAWNNTKLLGAILGLGAFCITYHPWRFAVGATMGCLIIKEILNAKEIEFT